MAVTISGTIRIDIELLELDLQKLEDLRVKIDEKIAAIIEKISQVADADNWPHIQEGSEQLKKIYEVVRGRIEKRIERVKQEINKVIEHVKQTENKVQSRFGQLLVDFGSAIQNFGKEPVIIPAIIKISENVKNGIKNVIDRIKDFNTQIFSENAFGTIRKLFSLPKNKNVTSIKQEIVKDCYCAQHPLAENEQIKSVKPYNLGDDIPKNYTHYDVRSSDGMLQVITYYYHDVSYDVAKTPFGLYLIEIEATEKTYSKRRIK